MAQEHFLCQNTVLKEKAMKLLVIDACLRGEASRTRRLYKALLEDRYADWEVEIIDLAMEDISPLTAEQAELRSRLVYEGDTENEMFYHANKFMEADRILVAAPYWDLSFPSKLRAYFEHISVAGITFRYYKNRSYGSCRAEKLYYLATAGGYIGEINVGEAYIRSLAQMLGIRKTVAYAVEGLDIDPSKAEEILEESIAHMLSVIK